MTLLAPLGGLALAAIPAILLLYFLKVRRRESDFSSTLLWRRAVRDRQANAPWQRLRLSRLLLLQLLAAALLAAALLRPALADAGALGAHTILVVETSGTMQATDVSPSRFEDARRQAREIVDRAGPGQRITLVEMGRTPRVAASARGNMGQVKAALAGLRPENGSADLQQALALAASSGGGGAGTRVILIGDGITRPLPAATRLPYPFEFRRVGISGENLAVTTLTLHPEPSQRVAVARVQNFGRQRQRADLEWHVDGRLLDARAEDVDAGAARDISFQLPGGASRVEVNLRSHDALALDDAAYGVATQARSLRVVLVSGGNIFLQNALALRPDLRVSVVKPAEYHFDPGVDLYVFDGLVPDPQPPRPSWYLNPPAGKFGAGQSLGVGRPRASSPGDPLMRDVDLREVHIARAVDLRQSTFGGHALFESDGGPLVLVRDEPTRAVLFGFDLHSSDLPLRTAFPVLVDHLDTDLLPPSVGPRAYHPGEPVLLPTAPGATTASVTRPDGHVDHLVTSPVAGYVAFDDTDQTGFYTVEQHGSATTSTATFAVNAGGAGASAITPRERIELVSTAAAAPAAGTTPDPREVWPWLAAFTLLVLCAEWLVFHRGG